MKPRLIAIAVVFFFAGGIAAVVIVNAFSSSSLKARYKYVGYGSDSSRVYDIVGVGRVNFPPTMTPADIKTVIETEILPEYPLADPELAELAKDRYYAPALLRDRQEKVYHLRDCKHIKGESPYVTFSSTREAKKAGYFKCAHCLP